MIVFCQIVGVINDVYPECKNVKNKEMTRRNSTPKHLIKTLIQPLSPHNLTLPMKYTQKLHNIKQPINYNQISIFLPNSLCFSHITIP